LIPQKRFSEGVELGLRGMNLPESDQTKNSQNNTAICYLRMGDTNSAKDLFTDSAENPYHSEGIYSLSVEKEAKYFLGEIAESEGNIDLAIDYYTTVVRLAEVEDNYVLPAKLALERLGVETVNEASEKVGVKRIISANNLTLIGQFAVDSGQAIVGDPCYLDDWKLWDSDKDDFQEHKNRIGEYGYLGACNATLGMGFGQLGNFNAVAFSTATGDGTGDGIFPVYADITEDGQVGMVVIDFSGKYIVGKN
jgi:hypothetical protein